jgi:RNA polymerase sigma-70 factor (ECF subfamily)
MKPSYNKSAILKRAWKLFKGQEVRTNEMFSTCMKESWSIAKRVAVINFGDVYTDNYTDTLNYVKFKVNGNVELAEDITSDVFEKALTSLHTFNADKSSIKTWLRRITNTCISDNFRGLSGNHANKMVTVSDFMNDEGKEVFQFLAPEESDQLAEKNETNGRIANAFRQLKPKYRKVAILFFLREKEYSEIAEICEIPMGTVKGMISRVRATLQSELKGEMQHIYA